MAKLHVELVSPEREVWTGGADRVVAKTVEGDIGILANHSPVLAILAEGGIVRVIDEDRSELVAAVHGGFISVADNEVTILAELAELSEEIDVAAARTALEQAEASLGRDEADEVAAAERRWAAARLRAAGHQG